MCHQIGIFRPQINGNFFEAGPHVAQAFEIICSQGCPYFPASTLQVHGLQVVPPCLNVCLLAGLFVLLCF